MRNRTFPARVSCISTTICRDRKPAPMAAIRCRTHNKFCARLAALGMRNDLQAVAYDASGGYYAARLWWMLRWVGHTRVAVLDGGWDAWLKVGFAGHRATPGAATRRIQRRGARHCGRRQLHPRAGSVNRTTSSSTRAVPIAFAAKTKRSTRSAVTFPARSTVSSRAILPRTGASNRRPTCASEFRRAARRRNAARRRAPVRLRRHRVPQPARHGNRGPYRIQALSRLVERMVQRCAAARRALTVATTSQCGSAESD